MPELQDSARDPYQSIKRHAEDKAAAAPGPGDIVSGHNQDTKAANTPALVGPDGTRISTANKPQPQPQPPVFRFEIKTFSQYCDDDMVRMMWRIINHNPTTDRRVVLMEFGYTKKQLREFVAAIDEHDAEIGAAKLKENLSGTGDE